MDDDFIIRLELDVRDAKGSAQQLTQVLARLNSEIASPELDKAEKSLAKFGGTQGEAAKKAENHTQSLNATRYALYDVSRTAGIAGAALIGLTVATAGVAIAFERDFANVVRTSQVTGNAIGSLRADLIELAQSIPLSFGEITQIATLGGQLGVAADTLANFTEVVAQFSATTGVSIDESATAFGRLNSLLPDVDSNYTALGSSILKVGVNSVATEAAIIKTATNLSGMATQAGLTAAEVVGLAGAFASIGVMPELARGTVTRTFSLIGKAVSEGGEKLDKFAKLAGVSSEELSAAYGTNKFGPIFEKFVAGIRNVSVEGGNASLALNDLGITSVRDVPALLNLANAADSAGNAGKLLAQTIGDANTGFKDQTELGRAYGIIADTTASKLTILGNNFQVFLDAVGSGSTGPIAGAVDILSDLLKIVTDIATGANGLGTAFLLVTGALGVIATLGAAALAGVAGIIAMQTALSGLGFAATSSSIGIGSLTAQLLAAGGAGTVAGKGLQAATLATKGLGVALGAAAFVGAAVGLTEYLQSLAGYDNDLDNALARIKGTINKYNISAELSKVVTDSTLDAQLQRSVGKFNINPVLGDLAAADELLASLAKGGNAKEAADELLGVAASFTTAGKPADVFNAYMTDSVKALEGLGYELKRNKDGLLEIIPPTGEAAVAVGAVATEAEQAEEKIAALADQLGISADELKSFQSGIASGSGAFFNFGDLIQRVQDKTRGFAEQTSKETYGSIDSWQEFYDGSSVNIYDFMALLDQQIANQQVWAGDLSTLAARGATGFVAEIAKMGPEAAPLAAAAVNLTVDELNKLEAQSRLAAFLGSQAFAEGFTDNIPSLQDAYAKGGLEAVQALIAAQVSNSPAAVAQVVAQFNLDASKQPIQFQTDVNTDPAERKLTSFLLTPRRLNVYVDNVPGYGQGLGVVKPATGGYIRGPGTGTSDSIPAMISNGEYVIKAASVRKYGTGVFDMLNRGVAKFASGGPVGYSAPSAPSSGGGVQMVQFSSSDRQLLAAIADRPVVLSGPAVAGAANASNLNSGNRGAS